MSIPETMRQIEVSAPGGPEALVLRDGPVPAPKPDEVLIRVMAAGVNRPDVFQRKGAYPPPPGASPLLGLEVAGEVVAMGDEAGALALGAKVCALVNGGGYAEYCVAPVTQCLPWPAHHDPVRAAAIPETYFTVWANLFDIGKLASGETVLVHGGSSGIGVTAIQLARAFGARVITTVGSEAKARACEALGAEVAVNYRDADFLEVAQAIGGVDVVLDMVGASYLERNLKALRMDGRLVIIAFLGGNVAERIDLTRIMTQRLVVTGSTMRPRTAAEKGAIAASLRKHVWPLLEQGRCEPIVHDIFPLAQAAEAHRLMESSAHIGKIMLRVAD